jgi:hypothetical protein
MNSNTFSELDVEESVDGFLLVLSTVEFVEKRGSD